MEHIYNWVLIPQLCHFWVHFCLIFLLLCMCSNFYWMLDLLLVFVCSVQIFVVFLLKGVLGQIWSSLSSRADLALLLNWYFKVSYYLELWPKAVGAQQRLWILSSKKPCLLALCMICNLLICFLPHIVKLTLSMYNLLFSNRLKENLTGFCQLFVCIAPSSLVLFLENPSALASVTSVLCSWVSVFTAGLEYASRLKTRIILRFTLVVPLLSRITSCASFCWTLVNSFFTFFF